MLKHDRTASVLANRVNRDPLCGMLRPTLRPLPISGDEWGMHRLLLPCETWQPRVNGIFAKKRKLPTQRKGMNCLRKPNEISSSVFGSHPLSVLVLTLRRYGRLVFYSGTEPTQPIHAGVGMLVSLQLAGCVDDWIPLEGIVWNVVVIDCSLFDTSSVYTLNASPMIFRVFTFSSTVYAESLFVCEIF